jgi:GDP-L-fucose synthase
MPTNLYGPGDKYDLEKSHVIPALLRKFDDAKRNRADEVVVWGTGTPRREFLYSDDMASAVLHLMQLPDDDFQELIDGRRSGRPPAEPALVNIGAGDDITISELARLVGEIVGFDGQVVFDTSKPDGPPRKLIDSNRLYATGWRPTVSLREGLRRTYRDYCERLFS